MGATIRLGRNLAAVALVAALLTWWLAQPSSQAGPDPFYGMVLAPDIDAAKAVPLLHQLGVHTVRLRTEVINWADPPANTGAPGQDGAFTQAPILHRAGFQVVLLVASDNGIPSYDRARRTFSWLLSRPGADGVDVVEVLDTLTDPTTDSDAFSPLLTRDEQAHRYVDGPLRAAWDVVHGGDPGQSGGTAGRSVLGGSFGVWQQSADLLPGGSWGLVLTQAYLRAGYLHYVDYAGLRPAVDGASEQVAWVRRARQLLGQTPVWISDWALRRDAYLSGSAYTAAMSRARAALHDQVAVACYDGFTPGPGTDGVVNVTFLGYRPAQPEFDSYRGWPKHR